MRAAESITAPITPHFDHLVFAQHACAPRGPTPPPPPPAASSSSSSSLAAEPTGDDREDERAGQVSLLHANSRLSMLRLVLVESGDRTVTLDANDPRRRRDLAALRTRILVGCRPPLQSFAPSLWGLVPSRFPRLHTLRLTGGIEWPGATAVQALLDGLRLLLRLEIEIAAPRAYSMGATRVGVGNEVPMHALVLPQRLVEYRCVRQRRIHTYRGRYRPGELNLIFAASETWPAFFAAPSSPSLPSLQSLPSTLSSSTPSASLLDPLQPRQWPRRSLPSPKGFRDTEERHADDGEDGGGGGGGGGGCGGDDSGLGCDARGNADVYRGAASPAAVDSETPSALRTLHLDRVATLVFGMHADNDDRRYMADGHVAKSRPRRKVTGSGGADGDGDGDDRDDPDDFVPESRWLAAVWPQLEDVVYDDSEFIRGRRDCRAVSALARHPSLQRLYANSIPVADDKGGDGDEIGDDADDEDQERKEENVVGSDAAAISFATGATKPRSSHPRPRGIADWPPRPRMIELRLECMDRYGYLASYTHLRDLRFRTLPRDDATWFAAIDAIASAPATIAGHLRYVSLPSSDYKWYEVLYRDPPPTPTPAPRFAPVSIVGDPPEPVDTDAKQDAIGGGGGDAAANGGESAKDGRAPDVSGSDKEVLAMTLGDKGAAPSLSSSAATDTHVFAWIRGSMRNRQTVRPADGTDLDRQSVVLIPRVGGGATAAVDSRGGAVDSSAGSGDSRSSTDSRGDTDRRTATDTDSGLHVHGHDSEFAFRMAYRVAVKVAHPALRRVLASGCMVAFGMPQRAFDKAAPAITLECRTPPSPLPPAPSSGDGRRTDPDTVTPGATRAYCYCRAAPLVWRNSSATDNVAVAADGVTASRRDASLVNAVGIGLALPRQEEEEEKARDDARFPPQEWSRIALSASPLSLPVPPNRVPLRPAHIWRFTEPAKVLLTPAADN